MIDPPTTDDKRRFADKCVVCGGKLGMHGPYYMPHSKDDCIRALKAEQMPLEILRKRLWALADYVGATDHDEEAIDGITRCWDAAVERAEKAEWALAEARHFITAAALASASFPDDHQDVRDAVSDLCGRLPILDAWFNRMAAAFEMLPKQLLNSPEQQAAPLLQEAQDALAHVKEGAGHEHPPGSSLNRQGFGTLGPAEPNPRPGAPGYHHHRDLGATDGTVWHDHPSHVREAKMPDTPTGDLAPWDLEVERLESQLAGEREKNKRLSRALGRYGTHDASCPVARMGIAQHEPPCRCGFASALAIARAALASTGSEE